MKVQAVSDTTLVDLLYLNYIQNFYTINEAQVRALKQYFRDLYHIYIHKLIIEQVQSDLYIVYFVNYANNVRLYDKKVIGIRRRSSNQWCQRLFYDKPNDFVGPVPKKTIGFHELLDQGKDLYVQPIEFESPILER